MGNLEVLFDAPILSVQLILDGILVGAIFALAAYGMALVWGVMNIINIAQGEFVMLGGFITFWVTQLGIHPFLTLPIAAFGLYVVGWLIYRMVIWRIVDRDMFISILATFGISIILQQLMNESFGADIRTAESGLDTQLLFGGMVSLAEIKLVSFVFVVLVGTCLFVFLKKSRLGQAIRATSQNARAARIMGIDTEKVYATTYALNAAICGAAGSLVVMTWVIHPFFGIIYTVRAFMIVIIAGLGNIGTVLLAGSGLGVAEFFAGFILGAEFQAAFVFGLLVVILVIRRFWLARKRVVLR